MAGAKRSPRRSHSKKKAPKKGGTPPKNVARPAASKKAGARRVAPKPPAPPAPPPPIVVEALIRASPGRVWGALTSADEVIRWLCARCEFEARPGGRVLYYWSSGDPGAPAYVAKSRWGTAAECRIEAWEPLRSFTLAPATQWPGRVTFRLTPEPGQTRVTVEHSGWPAKDEWYRSHVGNWNEVMDLLRHYVEDPEATYDAYLVKREGRAMRA